MSYFALNLEVEQIVELYMHLLYDHPKFYTSSHQMGMATTICLFLSDLNLKLSSFFEREKELSFPFPFSKRNNNFPLINSMVEV